MPRALLIAYYFPPIQEVGGFRTLRFAKFLPDFGWQPSVLTVSPESVHERVDAGLLEQCPETIAIRRTQVFNPVKLLRKALGTVRRVRRRPVASDRGGSEKRSPLPAVKSLVERMGRFASVDLGIDLSGAGR